MQGLRDLEVDSDDLSKLNKCLKTANVFRINESDDDLSSSISPTDELAKLDFTKCMAYKACKKTPDWMDLDPVTTTTAYYTTTPFVHPFDPDEPYKSYKANDFNNARNT